VEFEYDEAKSAANKSKHGLDFEEARDLWLDEDLLEIPARAEDEERFLVIARIAELHWSAVVTYRSGAIRLISVRRSRPEEVSLYEGE
jgi:uncharacterized DUF497 family protein